jgi:hypothetical protein
MIVMLYQNIVSVHRFRVSGSRLLDKGTMTPVIAGQRGIFLGFPACSTIGFVLVHKFSLRLFRHGFSRNPEIRRRGFRPGACRNDGTAHSDLCCGYPHWRIKPCKNISRRTCPLKHFSGLIQGTCFEDKDHPIKRHEKIRSLRGRIFSCQRAVCKRTLRWHLVLIEAR